MINGIKIPANAWKSGKDGKEFGIHKTILTSDSEEESTNGQSPTSYSEESHNGNGPTSGSEEESTDGGSANHSKGKTVSCYQIYSKYNPKHCFRFRQFSDS